MFNHKRPPKKLVRIIKRKVPSISDEGVQEFILMMNQFILNEDDTVDTAFNKTLRVFKKNSHA